MVAENAIGLGSETIPWDQQDDDGVKVSESITCRGNAGQGDVLSISCHPDPASKHSRACMLVPYPHSPPSTDHVLESQ